MSKPKPLQVPGHVSVDYESNKTCVRLQTYPINVKRNKLGKIAN